MGKKLMPCNLTPEEQQAAWEEFDGWLTPEEEEEVIECMDHYLFYTADDRGKTRECICTHCNCGRFIEDRKDNPAFWMLKHGRKGRCPRCGQTVTLQALGKIRSFQKLNDSKWTRVTVCRTGKNGALLLLSAYVNRFFFHHDLRPVPEISWKAWTYLEPGKRMQWERPPEWGCGNCWGYIWMENDTVKEPFQPAMYGEGGDSFFIGSNAIDRCSLKFCQLEEWLFHSGDSYYSGDLLRNVVKYLSAYTRYPTLEMAVKLGMFKAATDLVVDGKKNHAAINWDATSMQDFLRLNKQDAKVFFREGGNLDILAAYHTAKRGNLTSNMAGFLTALRDVEAMNYARELTGCAKKAGCTIQQAANYAAKQMSVRGTERVLIRWDDYLNMAKQLHFDMTRLDVTMPKDLQDRHDAAAETLSYHRKVEQQKKNKEFNKRLRKMYEFSYGDMCIVVPGSTQEIIMEGSTLKHCVGGYAARHFNDKVTILFLRHKRKPDTPFITIEIIPRQKMTEKIVIRQIHGYRNEGYLNDRKLDKLTQDQKHNSRPEYKYKWFLDVWRAWVEAGSKRDKKGNPILMEEKEKTA